MSTAELLAWIRQYALPSAQLVLDSRQVTPGDVFFACPGRKTDGRQHIVQAIQNGAAAVLIQADPQVGRSSFGAGPLWRDALSQMGQHDAATLEVQSLSQQLGPIAHEWYGRPSEALSVVTVTGTNGKTSSVRWLAGALESLGIPCGTVGTLGITLPDGQDMEGGLTTPDVLTMHRALAQIRDAGARVAAIEASSIGLDQGRLDAVRIQIAGFTNLTHDHLDYHGTLDRYKEAKFSLFRRSCLEAAVINVDDPAGEELAHELLEKSPAVRLYTYSLEQNRAAVVTASEVHSGAHGLVFNLLVAQAAAQIVTRLIGLHNISNLLLVAGVLHQLGWSLPQIANAFAKLEPVAGRLQVVRSQDCYTGDAGVLEPIVVVDYAHTPDALEHALSALRETAAVRDGRLICVFGCGGDRDKTKRPIMGRLAEQLADEVVLTNDNPRSEDSLGILDDILAGMKQRPVVEPDRASAILAAIWSARPQDVVLLAGKGHETWQEEQGARHRFDDREWARLALTWRQQATLSSDSRAIQKGQIFLAIKGEHFDGHDYLEQVRLAGACAAIVDKRNPQIDLPQFEVGDTVAALQRLGAQWRQCFSIPAIAVTGSNGKTTTKEMIASILRAWVGPEQALWTQGNLNNELGVPLTLLNLAAQHRAAVFELGMNHPGEIAQLADMARPTVGLVNNAQREHQEFMHSVEAVACENGSVISALPMDGIAVFPGDEPYTDLWRELAQGRRVLTFGLDSAFDIYASDVQAQPTSTSFRLNTPDGFVAVKLRAPGLHNLRNALAASACSLAAGASLQDIASGLQGFDPVAGRMQPYTLANTMQLIDDTYNANPDSVRAAIDVLADLQGPKVLVLGGMAEVGMHGQAMHAEVGAYAKERGIDTLLTLGPAARACAQAFGEGAHAFDDIDALLAYLGQLPAAHVLVKGSRSTRMERVVQGFMKQAPIKGAGEKNAS